MTHTIYAEGQTGLFKPVSDWTPPAGPLPMLRGIDVAIDTETCDLGLAKGRGSGWVYGRSGGFLCGVSVAWREPGANTATALYVPVRHPETECRQLGEVMAWVRHLLINCRCHFFNIGYDMGWIRASGIDVWPEQAEDGGTMAFLVDENYKDYSLDACCRRAGIPGKDETLLREAAGSLGILPRDIKASLWRLPGQYVGPYAEADAVATLDLCSMLRPTLEAEKTTIAYRTEMDLSPITSDMRWRGIRVDRDAAEQAQRHVSAKRDELLATIDTPWHRKCQIEDLYSPRRLARLFDAEGIVYPRTLKTNEPSFKAAWLQNLQHPIGKKVRRARQLHELDHKFLGTYILQYAHNKRIHADIRQLRAVTHRFSISDPPLQQTPARDDELAPLVRNVFLPEDGQEWLAADYSGQEPRMTVHLAKLAEKDAKRYDISMGDIDATVRYYREDPNPDLHSFNAKLMGVTRKEVKNMSLALSYRAGPDRLAEVLNMPLEEAREKWHLFHASMPYISGIAKYAEVLAKTRGYIRMVDGARRHFTLWQPKNNRREGELAFYEDAQKRWPGVPLERAYCYQAGNAVIQGSAARQMKLAMVNAWKAGIKPMLTMHDELGVSVSSAKDCELVGEIMRSAVRLIIPVAVDLEVGPAWGKAKQPYQEVFS